jgi:hypothetical protein
MDGSGMDLTMVSGSIHQQSPLYKGVRHVKVGVDIPGRRLLAVFLDVERNEGRASIVFEAQQCW